MKKNLTLILLAFAWLMVGSSCEKNTAVPENGCICNVKDPINDLPWLKEEVDRFGRGGAFGLEINRYNQYNDVIFEIRSYSIGAPERVYDVGFYNCSGNLVCGIQSGVFYKNTCSQDFFNSLTNKTLIYKK